MRLLAMTIATLMTYTNIAYAGCCPTKEGVCCHHHCSHLCGGEEKSESIQPLIKILNVEKSVAKGAADARCKS